MSYLPWLAGGAALGYAARRGRRASSIVVEERPPSDAFIRQMEREGDPLFIADELEEHQWMFPDVHPSAGRVWVASIGGKDVGVAKGWEEPTYFAFSDIYVLGRARRKGVNNALLDAVVASTPLPLVLTAAATDTDAQVASLLRRGWKRLTLANAKVLGSIDLEERVLYPTDQPSLIYRRTKHRRRR